MHKIEIISVANLMGAELEINDKPHYIVQIHHRGVNEHGTIIFSKTRRNFEFTFDDVNLGEDGFIDAFDAGRIVGIATMLLHMPRTKLYVSCCGGVSRSPAIAVAICKVLISRGKLEYKRLVDKFIKHYPHLNLDILDYICMN